MWVTLDNYNNYEVSNCGEVRNTKTGKLLTGWINKKGYGLIDISYNGKRIHLIRHRLVASHFIPNPNNYPCVNHIDENKQNNDVSNLEWCTYHYNLNHGTRNKRISISMTNGKLSKPVKQLTLDGELVKIWPSINEAGRNGYDGGCICKCFNKVYSQHKGFKWEPV